MRKPLPSQAELRELLSYDPLTGELRWKTRSREMFTTGGAWKSWNSRFSGKLAFTTVSPAGYCWGSIYNENYYAQRVIWKWMTGEEPDTIDHDDGDTTNNRWKNLNDGTHQDNLKNTKRCSTNTSGATGVSWCTTTGKWRARIVVDGHSRHLGRFDDFDIAVAARKAAERQYGFHPNHGRAS